MNYPPRDSSRDLLLPPIEEGDPVDLLSGLPDHPDTHTIHHSRYYIEDDMAIFLVENQLFKVHRYFLARESEVFRWMFMCPPREDGAEGGTDDRAIPLPGVTCDEFESLLDYFYDGRDRRVSVRAWVDLLSISTRFDFEKVRQDAIATIDRRPSNLDPINKIFLAEQHDIPQWLAPAYAALCQRANPIEDWEAEKLGPMKTARIARAREAVREAASREPPSPRPQGSPYWQSPQPIHITPPTSAEYEPFSSSLVTRIVNEVFFPPQIVPRRPKSPN